MADNASQSDVNESRSDISDGGPRFIDDGDDDDDMPMDRGVRGPGKRGARKRGFLKEDLAKMMKGFGESGEPRDDTLELLEAFVYEFTNNLVQRSLQRSQRAGFAQIQMRDVLKVIEKDEKKFLRMPYIITGAAMKKKADKISSKRFENQ